MLTVTFVDVPQTQSAAAAPKQPPSAQQPLERADEKAALITARLTGKRVTITGLTTETTEAVALPNGQIEANVAAAPVRMRGDNGWVPIDLTLRRNADGSIAPAAHPEGLSLTGARSAASGELAAVGLGDKRVSMGWVGALPEPVLDGSRATYPNVRPDIDLVVEATRTGFEEFLVVKSRAAVSRLAEISLPLSGKNVVGTARDASGGLSLQDKSGATVATVPAPQMWDAQVAEDGESPRRTSPVDATATRRAKAPAVAGRAAVSAGMDLTLKPDQAWLNDPSTVFPVTIDPTINPVAVTSSTYVTEGDKVTHAGSNDLQFGKRSDNGKRARSFVNWDSTVLRGKHIISATASFYNWYSTTCAANGWEIWTTDGGANGATIWSNQPPWKTREATSTQTKGFNSSCNDGWVSINATSFFQHAADNNETRANMGIRATNENATSAWKEFRSKNASDNAQVPRATVTYDSYPRVNSLTTVPAATCATGSGRPYLNTRTPQLRAQINDGDGSSVTAKFEWNVAGAPTLLGSATAGPGASGSWLGTSVPAGQFAEGGTYAWRALGYDGSIWGPGSNWCEFTVDTTAPAAAPAVSSSAYPQDQWAGGANTAGTFSFDAAGVADVAAYEYGLDVNPPNQTATPATLGAAATATVTPTADGPHTLFVRSRDRAGNQSAVTQYHFSVGAAGLTAPKTGDIIAEQTAITAAAPPATTQVTYQWRRGDADEWSTIPASDVTQAAGGAAVTWPFAGSDGQFAKLNWNVAKTLNDAEAGDDPLSGPLQVRGLFTGGAVSSGVQITFDRNQASAESDDIGPGSVNLVTGNLTVSDSDVSVDAYGGDLTVSRSFNTRRAADMDSANMFGPGWVSGVLVEEANAEYTQLDVVGSLAQVSLPEGDTIGFAKRNATAFDSEIGSEDLKLTYTANGDFYTLGDLDGNVTKFTRVAGAPAGRYFPTSITVPGSNQTSTVSWEKVTVAGVDRVRPTRMLAAVADGVDCTTLVRGCRALTFSYATDTTATGTTWGDYPGRVKEISFTAWDPDLSTPAMRTMPMARYSYDTTGRLRATWDPRTDYTDGAGLHHLWDTYGYDADGELTTIGPSAQEPWQLGYTTIPGDAGKGRLATVTRSALNAGTATSTVVYRAPVTGAGAPYDLSAGQTTRWGQAEPPVAATAVFPADQRPTGDQAAGKLPDSYERATLTYLDANARQVNTASPGGYLTTTWYDQFGNTTATLTAGNRQRALDAAPADTADAEAAIARTLSTTNIYSKDGQRLLFTYGPEHDVVLPDGSTVRGRNRTGNTYDEGAPTTGAPYNLVTTKDEQVRYLGPDGTETGADARTTKTEYDWALRQPTATIIDPAGLNQRSRTAYDPVTGQVTATTGPAGGASDATPSTRRTVYYRATTGSGFDECDRHPEWANLPCRVEPGGQADSGPELPVTATTYSMFNQPRQVTEKTSKGTLRSTTTTYDPAGRVAETAVSADGLGTAVPVRRNVYDPASGQLTETQSIIGGLVTASNSRQYDTLGRQVGYTDADGNQSTTGYDLLGRVAVTNDGKATRTYAYDGGTERRGLATSVVDSQAGTFTGSYDADGGLAAQTWPNGVSATTGTDETGTPVDLTYARTGCGADCTLYTESVTESAHGQWREHSSSLSKQQYSYDQAGRMTSTTDTVDGGCTTRSYAFDAASNRKAINEYGPSDGGGCQTAVAATTRSAAYDAADRITGAGYSYDALGRTTTVPAADTADPAGGNLTVTYHATDLVDTITQNGRTTDYTLDVDGERIRSWTDNGSGAPVQATHHYDGDDDDPAWTQETPTRYSRVVAGMSGMAAIWNSDDAAPSWQLANLHGDVIATIHANDPGLTSTSESTEYGSPRNTADAGTTRYGWLGTKQRAADTPAGIILMGVRLYNPTTGRFLQVDPIDGGNANDYDYCSGDPINCTDIDGKWSFHHFLHSVGHFAAAAYRNPLGNRIINAALVWGATAAVCGLTAGVGCAIAVGFVAGAATGAFSYHVRHRRHTWRGYAGAALKGGISGAVSRGGKAFTGRYFGNLRYSSRFSRVAGKSWQYRWAHYGFHHFRNTLRYH